MHELHFVFPCLFPHHQDTNTPKQSNGLQLLSPFFAYLSNDLSNWLFKLENKYIKRWGNLLIAQGEAIGE